MRLSQGRSRQEQQLSEEEEVMTKAMPAIWTWGQTLQTSLLLVHWKHEAETVSHLGGGVRKSLMVQPVSSTG